MPCTITITVTRTRVTEEWQQPSRRQMTTRLLPESATQAGHRSAIPCIQHRVSVYADQRPPPLAAKLAEL